MPSSSSHLVYAPASPPPTRRLLRRIGVTLVVLALAVEAWQWGPSAASHLNQFRLQRSCLRYVPAEPARTIYDDDPATAPALLATPGYASPYPASSPPRAVPAAVCQNPAFETYRQRSGPVLFMGRRTSPAGNDRLVVVMLWVVPRGPTATTPEMLDLRPAVELPRSPLLRRPVSVHIPLRAGLGMFVNPGDRTRLLEGMPDRADAAHFTIDYVHNAAPGTIDGRLNDDDTVTLAPRAGEVHQFDPITRWWSPAPGRLPADIDSNMLCGMAPAPDRGTRPPLPQVDEPPHR